MPHSGLLDGLFFSPRGIPCRDYSPHVGDNRDPTGRLGAGLHLPGSPWTLWLVSLVDGGATVEVSLGASLTDDEDDDAGCTGLVESRYPEWVPEIALRYLPVVESICAEPSRGLILEVGVNGSGLTTYLRRPVIGVDCVMGAERAPLVTSVLAKGQALPFQSRTFDSTVCMDTLEHIECSDRNHFLRELIRVTTRRVYIGCPMGRQSEREDHALQQYYRAQNGNPFPFLDEHIANGLPRLEPSWPR
jgi:Methylase involved in ubiquinone/menaquinone biosynthesis